MKHRLFIKFVYAFVSYYYHFIFFNLISDIWDHLPNSWITSIVTPLIPWSRKWQPSPVFLPGKFHGQRGLAGYSPWGHKNLDMTEHAHTYTHTHTQPYNISLVREQFHRRKSHPLFPCCKFSPWKFWISKGIHLLKR